jgi:hypothetical protein
LLDNADCELCVSRDELSWEDVVKLAGLFHGKDVASAAVWWKRKGL